MKNVQITGLSLILALAMLIFSCEEAALSPKPTPLPPLRRGPYLIAPSAGTVTISWATDQPSTSRVAYEMEGGKAQEATGISFLQHPTVADPVLQGSLPKAYQHEVTLEGLLPGQRYSYRVVSVAAPQPQGYFVGPPAPGDDFAFFLFGDTRTNEHVHQMVVDSMAAVVDASGPHAFVMHTGDMVEIGGSEEEWDTFFDIESVLLMRTPLIPLCGNHEAILGRTIYEAIMKPPPSTTGGNDRWFSADIGDVHIATLDPYSTFDEPQLQWLEQDLAASSAPFKIVAVHTPLYTSNSQIANIGLRNELLPTLEATGVQLVISGHNHLYERFFGNGIHFVVSGGGGAPLYDVADHPDAYNSGVARRAAVSRYHFVRAELSGSRLRLEAISVPDAASIDCFVIDANAPGTEINCE